MNKAIIASKFLTPSISGYIKTLIALPRFLFQLTKAKIYYLLSKKRYKQNILFIAGLPKSGTTWLERMLCSLPYFQTIMLPSAVYFEQKNNGSHNFEFFKDTFLKLQKSNSVLKLHLHGSANNREAVVSANLKYVVMFRDLRDVAVSYYFYVKNTPWHPEHSLYKNFQTTEEGLSFFGKTLLLEYQDWIYSWSNNKNEGQLVVKYEDLRSNTRPILVKILNQYEVNLNDQEIDTIVDNFSFDRLSKGKKNEGNEDKSFYRKGISGDWKNHFTSNNKAEFKAIIGQFLIDFEYEKDLKW